MKREENGNPDLWAVEPAPEIDAALANAADDPLGRVLLRHPPAIFPGDEPAKGLDAPASAAERISLFPDETMAPPDPAPSLPRAASAGARLRALLADTALCGCVSGASFLSAAAVVRRAPSSQGWIWCAGFSLVVSFFLVVPTLALFGRTPGMALADLSAEDAAGEKPSFAASIRRWAATAGTILLVGIPLITAVFDRRRRTPADLFSGRTLHADPEAAG